MIIKNLTRTGANPYASKVLLSYLFKYAFQESKLTRETNHDVHRSTLPFIYTHNVRSNTINSMAAEFQQNELYRKHRRRDSTLLHHTILSFAATDTAHLTDTTLKAILQHYIAQRGADNLYVCSLHTDRDTHHHLHIAMSPTTIDGNNSRLSQDEFAALKIEMDRFQCEHFPQMISLPFHGRAKAERAMQHKTVKFVETRAIKKAELSADIESALATAITQEQVLSLLTDAGHQPYYRNGIAIGVQYRDSDMKFRFATLGYDVEQFNFPENRSSIKEIPEVQPKLDIEVNSYFPEEEQLAQCRHDKEELLALEELSAIREDMEELEHTIERMDGHARDELFDDELFNLQRRRAESLDLSSEGMGYLP
ncbi:MAG: hypothetical protein JWN78_816 [Bacteroidota bacterium]|nr:hypothetical protein [Bacteroidota bacterium]